MLYLLEKEYKEKINGKGEQEIIDLACLMLKNYRDIQAQNGWIDLICLEPSNEDEKGIISKYLDIDILKKVYQYTYTGTLAKAKEISFYRFENLDSQGSKFITPKEIIDLEDAKRIIKSILSAEFLTAADMKWTQGVAALIKFEEDNDLKKLINTIPPETLRECGFEFEFIEPNSEDEEFSLHSWCNERDQKYYTIEIIERGSSASFTYKRRDIGGAIARDFKITQRCSSLDEIVKKRKERFEDDYYF